jgi:hypothetical protein
MEQYFIWYLFTVIAITLFCLGWRAITEPGKVFYPIRQLFEVRIVGVKSISYAEWNALSPEEKKQYKEVPKQIDYKNTFTYEKPIYSTIPFLAHPFVLCVVCMPSLWGTIIYWNLFVLSGLSFLPALLIYPFAIISCPFLTGYFWLKYKHLENGNT